ncbi:hypothetical protein [Bordetella phage FP1]|uniref:Uncharacterized protein n=1 Tax=Bordetella phage FP1 TaxID=1916125 RepID=A0A2D0W9I9_9CAUD|nr:hypothetical protein HOS31_gp25 [Bordetella phage FP1]APL99324.1 hypothetical protein [Bordetella phage FP1]
MSDTLEATKRELEEAGIKYTVESGKRHYKVRFTVRGRGCLVTCSRTSSDHRAALNARLQVRREIRKALSD